MTKPNKLLLAIDTQIDFVLSNGALPVPGAEQIVIPGMKFLMGLDPHQYQAALFTYDTHNQIAYMGSPENVGDEAAGVPGFPLHCVKGKPGWQNVFSRELLHHSIQPFALEKGVFDMWAEDETYVTSGIQEVERDPFFRELFARGIDTVTVIGVAADYCVMWAIRGLLERGFNVEVVEHLTAGIQRDMTQTIADEFPGQVALI